VLLLSAARLLPKALSEVEGLAGSALAGLRRRCERVFKHNVPERMIHHALDPMHWLSWIQ
jgi:hypothetical protein